MDEMINKFLFRPYKKFNKHKVKSSFEKEKECNRIIILHDGNSSTLAYFQLAFCEKFPFAECILKNINDQSSLSIQPGDAIVIVRFIPKSWQVLIAEQIDNVSKIIYFIDDDLLDPYALDSLAKDYRMRIMSRVAEQHRWLKTYCDSFWVSTRHLHTKYSHLNPEIVPPKPSALLLEPSEMVKVVYHGTSSHRDEKLWLHSVMTQVLQHCPHISFEIFGEHEIYKLYRGLPRVSVLHPMSWENYVAYTKSHKADIGLAPLLASEFNAARGGVKFYDFVRMGAAGIYSNVPSYSDLITHDQTGLLLDNDPSLWVDEIIRLSTAQVKRKYIAGEAYLYAKGLAFSHE